MNDKTKEVSTWADAAMFRAEPMEAGTESGPKVHLLEMTSDPLGSVAAMSAMYTGKVIRSKQDVTDADRDHHLSEMKLTYLTTPLESIQFHFLFEGVTRAFTHQLVRTRHASYAQESMRFAVKDDMPTADPPSLAGVAAPVHAFDEVAWDEETRKGMPVRSHHDAYNMLSENEQRRVLWDEAVENVEQTYNLLVNRGMPAEDARGLAPTNVKTRINCVLNLRTLLDLLAVRLCTQAQFEWRSIANQIAQAIAGAWTMDRRYIEAADEETDLGPEQVIQQIKRIKNEYHTLGGLFRPICYKTGKCEFMGAADRDCSIRERVQANFYMSRPSSEWHKPTVKQTVTSGGRADGFKITEHVDAIRPEEWMLNPDAAR